MFLTYALSDFQVMLSGLLFCPIGNGFFETFTQCLKITEKVSFNIASEASYVYILSGQKFIKNAKKRSILASLWKPEACGQTVLPDMSLLKG